MSYFSGFQWEYDNVSSYYKTPSIVTRRYYVIKFYGIRYPIPLQCYLR